MLLKTNYHTHSTYCDGANSPEQMAQAAYEKGLKIFGFSAHTMFPFSSIWHMNIEDYEKYFFDIEKIKQVYAGKMEILAGVEADYVPPFSYCDKDFYKDYAVDFIIGSVHYLVAENDSQGACFAVDGPIKEFYEGVQSHFAKNAKKAIQSYFATQRDMMQTCSFDIVGHIDLVRKHNTELKFFDENDSWYRNELKQTAKIAGKTGKVVEINTGGMSRSHLSSVYPSPDFLSILKSENVPVTINSDCHRVEHVADHFELALQSAKQAGYTEVHYLSNGTWHESAC